MCGGIQSKRLGFLICHLWAIYWRKISEIILPLLASTLSESLEDLSLYQKIILKEKCIPVMERHNEQMSSTLKSNDKI